MTRWLIVSAILTLVTLAACLYVGLVQPELLRERIPTHWNIDMEPDGWTDRDHYVWFLLLPPGVMAVMTLLAWLLPKISPRHFEIEPFAATWGYVMTIIVAYFGYLSGLMIWVGIADSPLWPKCFVAGFFALFALLGNVMGKVQRNYWMGIRTPWTLASETVWERTHRLAAWLWVAGGVVGGALVLLGVPFLIAFGLLMATIFWPAIYSLILYKRLQREGKL